MQTDKNWCDLLRINEGIEILDADRFRDIENFSEDMEFTREEFNKRLMICTVIGVERRNK